MKIKPIKPQPGQESVWDYPRPPALEQVHQQLRIVHQKQLVALAQSGYRVLETSHPPTYYLPISAFAEGVLVPTEKQSFCEFKGMATYYHLKVGDKLIQNAAWGYPQPVARFAELKGHVSVYASKVAECYVGDERVQPQEGDFYGGWITSKVVGPFKGGAGTWGW
jgi:uncharacterized protein (DUF427 family)